MKTTLSAEPVNTTSAAPEWLPAAGPLDARLDRPDWFRLAALAAMHAGCLGVIWVGWSPTSILIALVLYVTRAFGLNGLSTIVTSRTARLRLRDGSNCAERSSAVPHCRRVHCGGPLTIARTITAPTNKVTYTRRRDGFLWSHCGWFLTPQQSTAQRAGSRLVVFPELRWLDRAPH